MCEDSNDSVARQPNLSTLVDGAWLASNHSELLSPWFAAIASELYGRPVKPLRFPSLPADEQDGSPPLLTPRRAAGGAEP